MSEQKIGRLSWVDAARGLAALGVAVMHMFERLRFHYPAEHSLQEGGGLGNIILDFLNLGKIGVVVFFFISGYVIPFSLARRSLKQFVVSRFFRLYPAYWLSLFLAAIMIGGFPLSQLLANVTMFQRFLGVPDVVGVYWTLQIELVFYFVCIGLFSFHRLFDIDSLTKGFYVFIAISIGLAIMRLITGLKLPVALPLSLSVMFLGMILRNTEESLRKVNMTKFYAIFIVSLLIVCLFAYNKDYGYNEKWYKYFVSYTTGLLIFIGFRKWGGYSRILVFLGQISYSLYLLHPVIGLAGTELIKKNYFVNMGPVSYVLIFLILSIVSAAGAYYFIEKPSVVFGKSVIKKSNNVILSPEKP